MGDIKTILLSVWVRMLSPGEVEPLGQSHTAGK